MGYPANKECIWYIHSSPGSSIQLTIHDFDVEYHATCNFDVLEVGFEIVFCAFQLGEGKWTSLARFPTFLPMASGVLLRYVVMRLHPPYMMHADKWG